MNVVSFFAGCGGLDLGFEQAGFSVVWANEFDKTIHETYRFNHPKTELCTCDIRTLSAKVIPDCDGFIGGPPCQSWSVGGKMKGLDDDRGRLFLDYIRLIKEKKPKFFVIENVAGIISDRHFKTFHDFIEVLSTAGYTVKFSVMNAADFGVPQDRVRVFIVGVRNDLNIEFEFPQPTTPGLKRVNLRQAIGDIKRQPALYSNKDIVAQQGGIFNHDCYTGPYDKKFMARNRIRKWNEVSFTIQAQGRNTPIHPQAPPMIYISPSERRFDPNHLELYRRLSVRECARIQSFPDSFQFFYTNVLDGYKMVGNAVPPTLARILADAIKAQLSASIEKPASVRVLVGYYRSDSQLQETKKNLLYYVRTGFRPGAVQHAPGQKSPDFLLLHKRGERFLFKLKAEEPKVKDASELQRLGFKPHGDVYLCFELDSAKPIPLKPVLQDLKIEGLMPYITMINNF